MKAWTVERRNERRALGVTGSRCGCGECAVCRKRARDAQWRRDNPERVKERQAAWTAERAAKRAAKRELYGSRPGERRAFKKRVTTGNPLQGEAVPRVCLGCDQVFPSYSVGNRLCGNCKGRV